MKKKVNWQRKKGQRKEWEEGSKGKKDREGEGKKKVRTAYRSHIQYGARHLGGPRYSSWGPMTLLLFTL